MLRKAGDAERALCLVSDGTDVLFETIEE